jgi:hypothetical protein
VGGTEGAPGAARFVILAKTWAVVRNNERCQPRESGVHCTRPKHQQEAGRCSVSQDGEVVNGARLRDSAAIGRQGSSASVAERQGRYKKDKRDGLDSFSDKFWGLRGAANPGRGGSKSVGTAPVRHSDQESGAHQPKSGSDRCIKQSPGVSTHGRCLAQAGDSDPARGDLVAGEGKVSILVAVRWRVALPAGRVCRGCAS